MASPTSSRPVSVNSAVRARSRAKILSAAKELFLEDGYDGVNLERIATRAGVARQTVYNRFGSKDAVFRAVMEYHWGNLDPGALPSRLAAPDNGGDPAVFLRQFTQALLEFIDTTGQVSFTRMVIAESRRAPWIAEEFYRIGKEPLIRAFTACLRGMDEAGSIACPHPELAAHQFLGLIQEFVLWPHVMAIPADRPAIPATDVVVEEAIAMFLSRYRAG
ncbi:TetR/AcrR family transcriptional regulator [Streptomyces coffeae]|uniref:TetR/AcrR family transcriptional regulator n=1 Tax=Streptomyces coffeae TaxID=621382 RepID=A0ABS1NLP7_9ACTN|nr:TetR/AcrR family transcriptional regulator [Streptomyces coffeae]MBL1101031.1 TetR/AcrR family transcriptional regulator [Streptomyces coffeae]